jgi:hypothetical protein
MTAVPATRRDAQRVQMLPVTVDPERDTRDQYRFRPEFGYGDLEATPGRRRSSAFYQRRARPRAIAWTIPPEVTCSTHRESPPVRALRRRRRKPGRRFARVAQAGITIAGRWRAPRRFIARPPAVPSFSASPWPRPGGCARPKP